MGADLGVSLPLVILRPTSVYVNIAWGILMPHWGDKSSTSIYNSFIIPCLDMSLAWIILGFTSVDVSIA